MDEEDYNITFDLGDIDHLIRVVIVFLTGYLLFGELYITVMKLWGM